MIDDGPNKFGLWPLVPGWEYTKQPGIYRAAVTRNGDGNVWRSEETFTNQRTATERARKFLGQ